MNKVAIITGGAVGIGKAIVKELTDSYNVIIIADIAGEVGSITARELTTDTCLVKCCSCDLTKDEEVENLFNNVIKQFGNIDALVCNAGIQIRHWATEFPMDEFDRLLSINLRAYYLCAKTVAKFMIEAKRGSIVCISSVNGAKYHSKRSAYNISKAAINGLVGTLAVEWGRYGIRINAVAPGYVETEVMLSGVREGIIDINRVLSIIPMKRFIKPSEIGKIVKFLLSEASSAITGQIIYADGGWSVNALPEDKELA